MIKISISSDERKELEQFRRLSSSKDSEKVLMILLCSEGQKVNQIATVLKRNPHTVRDWLKRYKESGIKGLNCSLCVNQKGAYITPQTNFTCSKRNSACSKANTLPSQKARSHPNR